MLRRRPSTRQKLRESGVDITHPDIKEKLDAAALCTRVKKEVHLVVGVAAAAGEDSPVWLHQLLRQERQPDGALHEREQGPARPPAPGRLQRRRAHCAVQVGRCCGGSFASMIMKACAPSLHPSHTRKGARLTHGASVFARERAG